MILDSNKYEGKPCRGCGSPIKYKSGRGCVDCRIRKSSEKSKTPERKAQQAKLYEVKKDYQRYYQLTKRFGLTREQYYQLLLSQDYRCKICNVEHEEVSRGRLVVDHCHTTGKVRGLLCHSCNVGIGHLKESEELMLKAISYLK